MTARASGTGRPSLPMKTTYFISASLPVDATDNRLFRAPRASRTLQFAVPAGHGPSVTPIRDDFAVVARLSYQTLLARMSAGR
jgi:hypothetical protein